MIDRVDECVISGIVRIWRASRAAIDTIVTTSRTVLKGKAH